MTNQNQAEEMIILIYKGFDLDSISFEFDIPIGELQGCKKQLELRKSVKQSIADGNIIEAIGKLEEFIESTDNNIVERTILLRLQAYLNKTVINKNDLKLLDEEKKKIGFSADINKILKELEIQMPKVKSSNIKKKNKKYEKQQDIEENSKEIVEQQTEPEYDYQEIIEKYKKEIDMSDPKKAINARNKLAFAYFKANMIKEARDELLSIIKQSENYTAYRQLVHLEKTEGNIDEAKLWAWECADKFPKSVEIREILISIARQEHDGEEMVKRLNEISIINPQNEKVRKILCDKNVRRMIQKNRSEER